MNLSFVLLGAGLLAAPALAAPQDGGVQEASAKAPRLRAGMPAPVLAVSDWVKGEPVTAFQPDHVYVVEFWATWCGPCIASIPHLDRLQQQYGDRVSVVGVSNLDPNNSLEDVRTFVEERGDSMGYRVAFDSERATSEAWMAAAEQRGIPCSFLVDGDGQVAWIGHPMWLDLPLEKVVAGTWDAIEGARQIAEAETAFGDIYQADTPARGLELLQAFEQRFPAYAQLVQDLKFNLLIEVDRLDDAYRLGATLVDHAIESGDVMALNQIAWRIVDPEVDLSRRDLALALRAAEKAVALTSRKDASILDTLARVHFHQGDVQKALAIQEEAVALEPDARTLTSALEEYRAALGK